MSFKLSRLVTSLCILISLLALTACVDDSKEAKATANVAMATAKEALAAAQNTSPKVAVVNQERIYRESKAAQDAVAHLDAISENMRQRITDAQTEIQAQKDEEAARAAYEKILNEMQQEFTVEQQQVTVKVNDLFDFALEACRKEAGVQVVISSDLVLAFDATVDLTDKVLEKMNSNQVSYMSMEPDAPADGTLPASNATQTMPATNGTEAALSTNATSSQ